MQPGNRRFSTLVLVDTVGVEAVAAGAGGVVGDRLLEVVAAEEPLEAAAGVFQPALFPGHLMDLEEGIDHVLRLGRLLVETGRRAIAREPAVIADRHEMASRVGLDVHQPAQRADAGVDQLRAFERHAGNDQRVRDDAVGGAGREEAGGGHWTAAATRTHSSHSTANTMGPAAINGPTPGMASAPIPARRPITPPATPPVAATARTASWLRRSCPATASRARFGRAPRARGQGILAADGILPVPVVALKLGTARLGLNACCRRR
jgi:hypothetical protein